MNVGPTVRAQQLTFSTMAPAIIFFIRGDTHVYRQTELPARAVGGHYHLLNTISDRLEFFMVRIYSLLCDQSRVRADEKSPNARWRV